MSYCKCKLEENLNAIIQGQHGEKTSTNRNDWIDKISRRFRTFYFKKNLNFCANSEQRRLSSTVQCTLDNGY